MPCVKCNVRANIVTLTMEASQLFWQIRWCWTITLYFIWNQSCILTKWEPFHKSWWFCMIWDVGRVCCRIVQWQKYNYHTWHDDLLVNLLVHYQKLTSLGVKLAKGNILPSEHQACFVIGCYGPICGTNHCPSGWPTAEHWINENINDDSWSACHWLVTKHGS